MQPEIILGLIMGGAVIYWFTGASCQAVVTGAYRAVVYIKEHMKLDATTASEKDSKEVVRICTVYAQKGMWNIFIVIFCFALALPFFNPYFFIGYLIGIAFFGLFQAIFMANAGGAWDNAKKIVEVDLRQKGTDLHAATVVGDTVGDPFKDTSSVALNPVIKFTTLFGLLAVEIAVTMTNQGTKTSIGAFFFLVALIFVYRSFYGMRIPGRQERLIRILDFTGGLRQRSPPFSLQSVTSSVSAAAVFRPAPFPISGISSRVPIRIIPPLMQAMTLSGSTVTS